jgi:hypothetical protein
MAKPPSRPFSEWWTIRPQQAPAIALCVGVIASATDGNSTPERFEEPDRYRCFDDRISAHLMDRVNNRLSEGESQHETNGAKRQGP